MIAGSRLPHLVTLALALTGCTASTMSSGNGGDDNAAPPDAKTRLQAGLDAASAPGAEITTAAASLAPLKEWSVQIGGSLLVIGKDDAGATRAALSISPDDETSVVCIRANIQSECGDIVSAAARDLAAAGGAGAVAARSLRPLADPAPAGGDAGQKDCGDRIAGAMNWYADNYKSAQPTPNAVLCSDQPIGSLPAEACATLISGQTAGPGATATYNPQGQSMMSMCCDALSKTQSSAGSLLVNDKPVPLVCSRTPATS